MQGSGRADPIDLLRAQPLRTAILLDFDGSLSDIVARPQLARPVDGALEILTKLADRYALVAVVSGRPTGDLERLLGIPSVRLAGHYGRLVDQAPVSAGTRDRVVAAVQGLDGVWVEDKVESLAVHYRLAPEPEAAHRALLETLRSIARDEGLALLEGKMVLELVGAQAPRKGEAVVRLVREADAAAAMFAGDDLADLEAFTALDRLGAAGVIVVKVAVRGPDTPQAVLGAADVTVDGPAGLVELLRRLT